MSESGGVGGALSAYHNCPVGNRPPEANPLDTLLFSQLHRAVNIHVNVTKNLRDNKKFLLATPSMSSRAYRGVWEIAPRPETIAKDIKKVLDSFLVIAQHEGLAVDGLGDWSGRRHIPKDEQVGGQQRTLPVNCYDREKLVLHLDASLAPMAIVEEAKGKVEQEELDGGSSDSDSASYYSSDSYGCSSDSDSE